MSRARLVGVHESVEISVRAARSFALFHMAPTQACYCAIILAPLDGGKRADDTTFFLTLSTGGAQRPSQEAPLAKISGLPYPCHGKRKSLNARQIMRHSNADGKFLPFQLCLFGVPSSKLEALRDLIRTEVRLFAIIIPTE